MDEQKDTAAELQAQAEATARATGEALRPLAEFIRQAGEALGRAARAWIDENRPALEAMARVANDPAVRAYIEARKRGEIPAPELRQGCHCLCAKTHPGEHVCDGEAVTSRRYVTELLGPVDVPLCAPCAVAQGVAELERTGR